MVWIMELTVFLAPIFVHQFPPSFSVVRGGLLPTVPVLSLAGLGLLEGMLRIR